jgi:hypothetical protein
MENKIKVLCLSIWYPLSMSRYFEKALQRRDDVDLITTGPFTGTHIPWMGGMTLPQKYAKSPTLPLPFGANVGRVSYDLVRANLPAEWKPDVVLTVDAGISWTAKPHEGVVAHVATDPHVLNYDHQREISDHFFNMQACYSKREDEYLPYAYDPTVHYPHPYLVSDHIRDEVPNKTLKEIGLIEKDTDAVLIGMPYDNRVKWVNELRNRGLSVLFENGPIFDEYREINNRARIGLNWSSMDDLNARAFELAAMRLCPVMNRVPDLERNGFIDGFNYLGFSNMQEAVDQVLWAKEHLVDAQIIANRAYGLVALDKNHTYDNRVGQILRSCGF